MPRLYSPVQTPSYFVGRSGREDVAAARAQEVNQRAMLQRQQAFRQYAQTRQAGQMQRQAQRAAQQQQAFQAQQLQADRDFQMQRDRFGAQRDYGMQERRLGAAAEEARLGREFQMDQADVRFGQQQDLAMQEQDYRLQQLDIAAENQYLSTEQQAQIQRERDILVNEMQRAAAAEGRFEQFGYGQMAADAAARRPLSVAERQRLRFSDELDARSQGRGARHRADEQRRAADVASRQITQRHELGMEATAASIDQKTRASEYLGALSHVDTLEVMSQTVDNTINLNRQKDVALLERAWFNSVLLEEKEINQEAREQDKAEKQARDVEIANMLRPLYEDPDRFGGVGSPEFREQENKLIEKAMQKPLAVVKHPSAKSDWDTSTYTNRHGVFQRTPGGFAKLADPERKHFTPSNEEVEEGEPFEHAGQTWMYPPGSDKPVSFGETPKTKMESAFRLMQLKEVYARGKKKEGLTETEEYLHSPTERRDMLKALGIDVPPLTIEDQYREGLEQRANEPPLSMDEARRFVDDMHQRYGKKGEVGSVSPSDWELEDAIEYQHALKVLGGGR